MMYAITPQDVEAFLTRYKDFTTQQTAQRFQAFAAGFRHMRAALRTIKALGETLEQQRAPRFNLFQLLGVAENEVGTHSALLADLLRPEGTHGQGTLFLDAFLTYCQKKWADFPRPQETTASVLWTVGPKNTHWGNLDLVIECTPVQAAARHREQDPRKRTTPSTLALRPMDAAANRLPSDGQSAAVPDPGWPMLNHRRRSILLPALLPWGCCSVAPQHLTRTACLACA